MDPFQHVSQRKELVEQLKTSRRDKSESRRTLRLPLPGPSNDPPVGASEDTPITGADDTILADQRVDNQTQSSRRSMPGPPRHRTEGRAVRPDPERTSVGRSILVDWPQQQQRSGPPSSSPAKRKSHSPEKSGRKSYRQQPQRGEEMQRPRSREEDMAVVAESEIPAPDFSLLRLRRHDKDEPSSLSDYWEVERLSDARIDSLKEWWEFYQKKDSKDFGRWWKLQQSATKCCGCKIVTKADSSWPEGKYRCTTCAKPRKRGKLRPCLRLQVIDDGGAIHRVVEVMPEEGKHGIDAFAYWDDSP